MEQSKRDTILELYRAGQAPSDIVRLLKCNKKTVYNTVNAFNKSGKVSRKKHKTRNDKKRTPTFLAGLKRSIMANPGRPMTSLAKQRKVAASTVRKAVKEDLKLTSYVKSRRHLLTTRMKEVRLERSKKLLSLLKHQDAKKIIFFSDEKKWDVDQTHNRQNDRWLAKEKGDVPVVFRTKNPASVMTLGVISSQGHVMPPHFFSPKETVNTEVYLSVLEDKIKPWMDEVAAGKPYVFQQDSAPAHTSKKTQAWLKDNVPSFWDPKTWPSNSPDLNPLDYFF